MTGKHLITTDNWFYAPDGKLYRAVWGDVQILDDTMLGVKTNRNASNWYARVGTADNHVIVAGCQIHYAVRCEAEPNTGRVEDWRAGGEIFERPTGIFIAK